MLTSSVALVWCSLGRSIGIYMYVYCVVTFMWGFRMMVGQRRVRRTVSWRRMQQSDEGGADGWERHDDQLT
jgi:hypothetical protein